jgi:regulator of PEP synthase PpsR (kinase-PPPase family)
LLSGFNTFLTAINGGVLNPSARIKHNVEGCNAIPLEEINRCITEYEQLNFIFSDNVLKKIRDECNSWKTDWVVSFKKLLRRIRKEKGTPAHDGENGDRVVVPLVKNRYMAIYYKSQNDGSYFIYKFTLGFKN